MFIDNDVRITYAVKTNTRANKALFMTFAYDLFFNCIAIGNKLIK